MFSSDIELAKKLQREEFEGKRWKSPKKENEPSSLIDPTWELIDPNPNIYSLFQAFDKKFFGSTLGSVEVKWSPRMYSCAGICTYKGRAGCVVSLSLPLLKLRPRKDLIETLLHEMIHAYLFLHNRDRDHDGHGPNFHKHMNRINAEAGTHITVYHSFRDEVHHYKTHWWRCEGPCRFRKPFFGIVKRAMNRAPGPSDFWFAQHQMTCGGNFIKIQEPEGFKSRKKKSGPEQTGSSPDIRKYLKKDQSPTKPQGYDPKKIAAPPSPKKVPVAGSGIKKYLVNSNGSQMTPNPKKIAAPPSPKKVPVAGSGIKKYLVNSNGSQMMPKTTLSDLPKKLVGHPGTQTSTSKAGSNVKGLSNGRDNARVEKIDGTKNVHGFGTTDRSSVFAGGLKSNKGGTLVQTPKTISNTKTASDSSASVSGSSKPIEPFSGTGYVLASSGATIDRSKSKLLSLYPPPSKKPKMQSSVDSAMGSNQPDLKPTKRAVRCPVCEVDVDSDEVNEHLDSCVQMDFSDEPINSQNLPPSPSKDLFTNCPICGKSVFKNKINDHVDACIQADSPSFVDLTEGSSPSTSSGFTPNPPSPSKGLFACCPVCDKKVFKTKMDEHLDSCLSLDSIMDSSSQEIEGDVASGAVESDIYEEEPLDARCPCCDKIFSIDVINAHLDDCLQRLEFD